MSQPDERAPERARVLIVEDDRVLATLLVEHLRREGLEAAIEGNGARALERARAQPPDAVILDGNLPGADGFEVCRGLRAWFRGTILMLTSREDDLDRVRGLELGADDYLVKPVRPQVALAHLKACLRRTRVAPAAPASAPGRRADSLRFGRLRIDRAARSVRFGEREVALTTAEFDLLWQLAGRAGDVLARDDLLAGAVGAGRAGADRAIDMRVSRLRRRLGEAAGRAAPIRTVRGRGYLFSRTGWD